MAQCHKRDGGHSIPLKHHGLTDSIHEAAYQSAQKLYNERLGQIFEYRNKEEVIFSEVLLPENAPDEFKDREKLWNAGEKKENKSNSRYARQFIIALPNSWSQEECIEHSREFIHKALVSHGMCADWAFHEKFDKETGTYYAKKKK